MHSYSEQTVKVSELNERIEKLTSEINFLRSSSHDPLTPLGGAGGSVGLLPESFDTLPYPDFPYTGADILFGEDGSF